MRSREEIIASMLKGETYLKAIEKAPEGERKNIEGMIQGEFLDVIVSLETFLDKIKTDVGVRNELSRVAKDVWPILKNNA
jgi:hypothetical protein